MGEVPRSIMTANLHTSVENPPQVQCQFLYKPSETRKTVAFHFNGIGDSHYGGMSFFLDVEQVPKFINDMKNAFDAAADEWKSEEAEEEEDARL